MNRFQILDWDSEFFEIPIAQILPAKPFVLELDQVISRMKNKNVKLTYWVANQNDEGSQGAQLFHGSGRQKSHLCH